MTTTISDERLESARRAFAWTPMPTTRFVEVERLAHLESGLNSLLGAAVLANHDRAGVESFLRDHGYVDQARKQVAQAGVVIELVLRKEVPSGGGGPYYELAIAATLWLLGEDELGEREVEIAQFFQPSSGSTRFWREYGSAMTHLVERRRYERAEFKVSGIEKYWSAYLDLVAALTNGGEVEPAVASANAAFASRNRDKRLASDGAGYEGDGHEPVGFDFRLHGILAYAASHGLYARNDRA